MKIITHKEIDTLEWQQLTLESPVSSFFQSKACYDFYCTLSFLEPFLFGVEENDKLVGLICGYVISDGNKIKQFFSRRAIVPGGMLLSTDCSNDALKILLDETINSLRKKAIYIEFRNYSDYSKYKLAIQKARFNYHAHLNFHLNVSNQEHLLSKISESKVRQIKQTEKAGVIYEELNDKNDIHEFYNILLQLYKLKIRTPIFPIEFFIKIANQDFSKFYVVKSGTKVLGGIICVFDHKKVYEWFVCGSDIYNLGSHPSVLATWAGINFASNNGFEVFDFMGAGKPDKEYGVRDFKAKFGGELVEHGRFLYICNKLLYIIGKIALKIIALKPYSK